MESSILLINHEKPSGTSPNPFPFIYGFFPKVKTHNMCMMLNPFYKGLELVIQFVSKEITLQIADECDHQILLPFLIFAYNFLNPNDVGVKAPNSTSQSIKTTNLCDFMETNEEMASPMVKK